MTKSYNQDSNHKIAKALRAKGFDSFEYCYSSPSEGDYGYTIVNTKGKVNDEIFGIFLGFTIKEALKKIKGIKR